MKLVTIEVGGGYRYEVPVHLIAEIFTSPGGWGSAGDRCVETMSGKRYCGVENLEDVRRAVAAYQAENRRGDE